MDTETIKYDLGILKLIKIVKQINDYENSAKHVAKMKNKLKAISKSLQLASDELGDICLELILEEFISKNLMPFKATSFGINDLIEACAEAIKSYPDSRKKHALNYAAKGFCHLKYFAGKPCPKLTNTGEDVKEFSALCTKAGIPRSDEACRNSLSTVIQDFDPHTTYDQFSYLYD